MKTFKLLPTDGRKSLTNHHVSEQEINGEKVSALYSYCTRVAEYNHDKNDMQVFGWYSATTARHINHFLEFYGFDKCTKEELKNYN